MNTIRNLLMLAVAGSLMAVSQQRPAVPPNFTPEVKAARTLAIVETATFQQAAGESTMLPPACDAKGNVYVRPYYSRKHSLRSPVYEFSPRGERKAVYSLASDSEFTGQGKGGADFAIGKDGEVYQLALSEKGTYIVQFDQNGAIKSKIRLQAGFSPYHFAVFDSGEFLVTGSGADDLHPHAIYTGIFDRGGKMVKKVVFAEDEQYAQAANRGDAEFTEPGNTIPGNYAVDRGAVVRASNGNLYVVRWTTPARVYAVSPAGEIMANFEVTPPIDGKKPSIVVSHGNRLAIEWEATQNDPRAGITVVGLDGQPYATYSEKLGVLACYSDQERFTFLGGTELRFAQPR
jgi:outer membrane protein assembly factor BamB